jgi:hypothetical protein
VCRGYNRALVIQDDPKLLSGFPWPINFQTENNKIKLVMEYENVPQKVLLLIESMLQDAKQLQRALLSWQVRCPSDIHFPPSVLQHLQCNCFDRSNNSELQFIEESHRDVLNVSSQEELNCSVLFSLQSAATNNTQLFFAILPLTRIPEVRSRNITCARL